jgi:hypothetical protein
VLQNLDGREPARSQSRRHRFWMPCDRQKDSPLPDGPSSRTDLSHQAIDQDGWTLLSRRMCEIDQQPGPGPWVHDCAHKDEAGQLFGKSSAAGVGRVRCASRSDGPGCSSRSIATSRTARPAWLGEVCFCPQSWPCQQPELRLVLPLDLLRFPRHRTTPNREESMVRAEEE